MAFHPRHAHVSISLAIIEPNLWLMTPKPPRSAQRGMQLTLHISLRTRSSHSHSASPLQARAARIMTPRVGRVAGVAAVAAAAAFVAAPAAAAAAAPKVNGTAVPYWGKAGTKYERTFIAVKPDGVQRELIPEVMVRARARPKLATPAR